jgi:hypothetical protein
MIYCAMTDLTTHFLVVSYCLRQCSGRARERESRVEREASGWMDGWYIHICVRFQVLFECVSRKESVLFV